MLRILIADAHSLLRRGVRHLIETHSGWEVCAEAEDGERALDLALRTNPDVAILDVLLPKMDGLVLTERLRKERPNTRVLIFTRLDDDRTVSRALAAGARGYILKTDAQPILEAAIGVVGANRPYFSSPVSELLLTAATGSRDPERLASFTPRELEVGQLVAEGNSNKQIARRIGISIKTVECHRSGAMRKASVHSGPEFVRFAIKHNLIQA